jgi:hypothetical protein
MMARMARDSDDGNEAFAVTRKVTQHKPGLDLAAEVKDDDTGNHRFKRREQKDIPLGTLAERIAQSTKGK